VEGGSIVQPCVATILVVDDDADIREIVSELLILEGYRVETASHGRAALDVLEASRPDLILLDLNMPIMDGWTFCAELHAQPEQRHVPIALMSASRNLQARALPCEPVAILEKPFGLDDLLQRVEDALERTASGERVP
jgi:CheY-like chemotaxis protein